MSTTVVNASCRLSLCAAASNSGSKAELLLLAVMALLSRW
jgi:hypothetical protein